jgi:hypothetical protein
MFWEEIFDRLEDYLKAVTKPHAPKGTTHGQKRRSK